MMVSDYVKLREWDFIIPKAVSEKKKSKSKET